MDRVRQVESFDRNWLDRVNAGESITSVLSESQEKGKRVNQSNRKKSRPLTFSLEELGELLTPNQAAEILKVQASSIYEWIYQKRLKSVRVGRHIRIGTRHLEDFLSGQAIS